jgi:Ca2+-transporting ATPase
MLTREVINRSFWALPVHEVLNILETQTEGLAEESVAERQIIFKKNLLPEQTRLNKIGIIIRQFESPLILLLVAAVVLTALLGDWKDAGFISIVVLANVLLGFYQENKAEAAIAHLKTYIRERARVFRNGQEMEIEAAELVPGDIIRLSQGDRAPADCRLIYNNDLAADESILTGESLPVNKITEPVSFRAVIGDQRCMIFRGTFIVQGVGNAVVCRTGLETELGKIALMVGRSEKEKTPLQQAIIRFSLKASAILMVLTAAVFFGGVIVGKPFSDMFLTAVAIMVAAVPAGLPVAMTVILAIGVQRLSRKNGIVRKLLAAETLGSASVILTDKTGTLTEAKITLSAVRIFSKNKIHGREESILKFAVMNSDVVVENPKDPAANWRIIGRPLEAAVVKAAAEKGFLYPKVRKEIRLVDYLPFSSANKFSASVIEHAPCHLLAVFGAAEIVLKFSDFSDKEQKPIHKAIHDMAHGGERVLAVAIKEVPHSEEIILRDKKTFANLEFLGTLSFRDPVRPGIRDVIERVRYAGIRTVIVTGDHQGTALAVAKELGFSVAADEIINGSDLDSLSDDQLKLRLPALKIVSRVSPEGKVRIARGFKNSGETVAMTGDGLNDAASLKEADIGAAMGSGVDVAKDVADLVLLDNNFSTIAAAIEEGRRIVENIRKAIIYFMSSVFDELILIGGALILGLALPLNALQILFHNFIIDTFPAIGLSFEDRIDYLMEKRRRVALNLFDKEMRLLTLTIGIPTSLILLMVYWLLLYLNFDPATVRTFIFTAFSSYSLFMIFSVRSLRRPIFSYNPFSNKYLFGGIFLGLTLVFSAVYWTPLQSILGTTEMPLSWLLGVAAVGIINITAIELGKLIIRRRKL